MLNKLREILGVATPARAAQPNNRAAQIGSAGRMNPNNTKIGKALQNAELSGEYMPAQPISPAQRYFPGRTNYGVPQDNMIDTSMGYLTPDQYNQGITGRLQRQLNPMGFDTIPNNFTGGRTGYYQGSNPYLNNLDDDYRLRVR